VSGVWLHTRNKNVWYGSGMVADEGNMAPTVLMPDTSIASVVASGMLTQWAFEVAGRVCFKIVCWFGLACINQLYACKHVCLRCMHVYDLIDLIGCMTVMSTSFLLELEICASSMFLKLHPM